MTTSLAKDLRLRSNKMIMSSANQLLTHQSNHSASVVRNQSISNPGIQSTATLRRFGGDTTTSELTSLASTQTPTSHELAEEGSNTVIYFLMIVAVLLIIAAFSFVIVYLFRKSRIDRLRKHLMPLYQYDPAEEDGDWENELLNDDKQQQVALRSQEDPDHSPLGSPKLKFHAERI